jgi:hypothetical protein
MDLDDAPLANIMLFMEWLVWGCINFTPPKLKNPMYLIVFASQAILEDIFAESGVDFASGLLQVFQSDSPPTTAYFKSLPTIAALGGAWWAVYVLVLEKAGSRPKIYVGSSTHEIGKQLQIFQRVSELFPPPSESQPPIQNGTSIWLLS